MKVRRLLFYERHFKLVDNISKSAVAFKNLLNKKYHIVIGKKGKEIEIDLSFLSVDFHHLAGLHKLKDLRLARDNREDVFFDILNNKITDEFITKTDTLMLLRSEFSP